jgi:hypothetical protein
MRREHSPVAWVMGARADDGAAAAAVILDIVYGTRLVVTCTAHVSS